ncbi:CPBP family intramembrane glutamic endopeptidase [Micromonospora sp. NPDC003816]|uniref:CPBP family intramembrane glutamic endopeptidase n=1 Tax=Micromonospora sp. NPDC003816 TaxID=3364224 RepID=UPI00367E952A
MTITLPESESPTPAPAPVPYHRLARTDRHRWWRPLLGTLLIMVGLPVVLIGGFGAASAVVWLLDGPEDFLGGSPEAELAVTMVTLGLLIPLTLLAARWVQRRPAGTVSSVVGRLRWRWLATCLLVAVPALVLHLGVLSLLPGGGQESDWAGWERVAAGLAVVVLLVPLQAAGEEYLFRGWLIQAFGSWIRSPWPGIAVSSVLFGLAHGWGTGWGMADLVFFGAVTAVVTIRTGGLEAAIALHVVNNVAGLGFAVVTGTLEAQQADVSARAAMISMCVTGLYGGVVLWLARRRRVENGTGHASVGNDDAFDLVSIPLWIFGAYLAVVTVAPDVAPVSCCAA